MYGIAWNLSFLDMLYTLIEHTDTFSRSRLFLDGRLAVSSCLVGCAGMGPPQTSWQTCSRQLCACLLSSGMIHAEQKHYSTESLAPRPGAICKTLQGNTRASYDPQQGGVNREGTPPSRHVPEVKSSCHVALKCDSDFTDHELITGLTVARRDSQHPAKTVV